ncbi:ABC transporter substrate-binding protein [Alicyclobacillus fastidiosus]|uniref:ABC transporter substrate-binding protein n=1 Tax=Alicyclobacillus fastidiosus TaxID=392011 RepID=A0ABY6ZHM6_9BACL|nr:ABC transporter substrate-binding protein [Alicyclobacillus fastidiosus]WAH42123.1 ABC transporter substrate-binding protein [Alicyclobacillus fastidiosus]GMA63901.1 peptide ABC transporter substrate-binding protein [Alicyclobacillus fastidiosus]
MSKRWFGKGIGIFSSMALLGLVVTGCGTSGASTTSNNSSASQTKTGGTITIDEIDDFAHLDPALAYDDGDWEVVPQFYDQLVTYKPGTSTIVPDVATDYTVSSDGLTYTFHLHKGVKFWNGDTLTAQSFIDEFQRVLSKKVNSPGEGFLDPAVKGAHAYYEGTAKTISGITAPDPYTLVIQLTQPEAFFPKVLAMPFFSAVDQKFIDQVGNEKFDHDPMGTGPWEMKSYEQGNQMVLVKNPNYFKPGEPKLDEIDIDINKNEDLAGLNFKSGKTAFIGWNQNIDSQTYISLKNDPKYKNQFQSQPLVATYYLALNTKPNSPIQNKLVRQAIEMAVDKQKLVQLQNGRAEVANQILPPAMPGYEKTLPSDVDYQYSPAKAKQLLAQAGYPNGFKVSMLTPNDSTSIQLMTSIQADLKQIGIDVTLDPRSSTEYLQGTESLKYPLVYTAWFQDFPDPYDFLDILLNGDEIPNNNWSNYNNPTVDKELAEAKVMPDGAARYALYDKIQNQVLADAPWVPLYTPVLYAVVQPNIKGFYMGPVLEDPLQNLSLSN